VVDGKITKAADKDGKLVTKIESWSPEKIKEFEDIVASSVGLDKKRGDILDIKNIEFSHEDFEEVQRFITEKENKNYIQNLITYGVAGLIIVLFFMFVVRPFIKWITENTIDSVDTFLPQTIEELEKLQKNSNLPTIEETVPVMQDVIDPAKVEGEMIKEKIITLIDSNPHKAALILRDWLHSEASKKVADGKAEPGAKGKERAVSA
jgi:flagellar M-ring protein FliF